MMRSNRTAGAFEKFLTVKPKVLSLSQEELIETSFLEPAANFPLVVRPAVNGVDLPEWARNNQEFIAVRLRKHGAILFRGFGLDSVAKFDRFSKAIAPELMEYHDQHTPRTKVGNGIYTSTEYPADHHVPFHSENSKNYTWPLKIWFFCLQPATRGGETPIADNRRVYQLIDPKIRQRFIEKRVMYLRNFGEGLGLSWQIAFQTTVKSEVEAICRNAGMEFEWKDNDRLRVRHVCQSVAVHPQTGDNLWFNQAHLFHVSNLEPVARESLLEIYSEEDLPSNAYYGDGSPIEDSVLDHIRESYWQSAATFPWQAGDVVLLDNMLIAHGRTPYAGARKILVSMAESYEPFSFCTGAPSSVAAI